jgi:hypothetical protein
MTIKLYVTRWVLARGILLMTAKLGRHKGLERAQKDWYSLETGKWDRYRRHWVCIGRDAFLTLGEAQEAARLAFEEAAQEATARAQQLTQRVKQLTTLQVHDLTRGGPNISELHSFKR